MQCRRGAVLPLQGFAYRIDCPRDESMAVITAEGLKDLHKRLFEDKDPAACEAVAHAHEGLLRREDCPKLPRREKKLHLLTHNACALEARPSKRDLFRTSRPRNAPVSVDVHGHAPWPSKPESLRAAQR